MVSGREQPGDEKVQEPLRILLARVADAFEGRAYQTLTSTVRARAVSVEKELEALEQSSYDQGRAIGIKDAKARCVVYIETKASAAFLQGDDAGAKVLRDLAKKLSDLTL